MKVVWVRGNENIQFNRPNTFFVPGTRGSGKSSLLETIGMHYLEEGHAVLDLFGSRDGEALAWLRSTYAKDKNVLLLHGESVDVDCSWPVKKCADLQLSDLELRHNHQLISLVSVDGPGVH